MYRAAAVWNIDNRVPTRPAPPLTTMKWDFLVNFYLVCYFCKNYINQQYISKKAKHALFWPICTKKRSGIFTGKYLKAKSCNHKKLKFRQVSWVMNSKNCIIWNNLSSNVFSSSHDGKFFYTISESALKIAFKNGLKRTFLQTNTTIMSSVCFAREKHSIHFLFVFQNKSLVAFFILLFI